jgi:hypothetical protein
MNKRLDSPRPDRAIAVVAIVVQIVAIVVAILGMRNG